MKNTAVLIAIFFVLAFFKSCDKPTDHEHAQRIKGLKGVVEIVVDKWGIPHIYAGSEEDLFFAQGYNAARDRLFQLEIWRRQATGTVAEILGGEHLDRDIGTRLFMFRGDIKEEMNHYHPRGELIITSFVKGVNAYITETINHPELLPPEFNLLGIKPEYWTPEVVISRHQGLLGNINQELNYGRAVAALGVDEVKSLAVFTPSNPDIALDSTITSKMLEKNILGIYNAYRQKVTFDAADLDERHSGLTGNFRYGELESVGSNNWILSGDLTQSGFPVMANDPHRTQTIPSLRYWVHLSAPGWDVIGGGEPEIPGVSIGHNGFGAWGLTVFRTDAEDLYVYDLNPRNLNQYKYQGAWENLTVITDTIPVMGRDDKIVELKYTRHGPVTFIDSVLHKAYAVRCGWLETGGSPYLASLRMDQAKSWEEFREACSFSNIPGENMVWADKAGNIGWQAVGIAPVRRNWSGLVPVPGDGRFEWEGYLPIIEKPHLLNPENGFFATANQYVVPEGYNHMDAIGFSWSDPFRGDRLNEVLNSGSKFSMDEMKKLQTDYLSRPAKQLVPLLKDISMESEPAETCKAILLKWDYLLSPESVEAGIYVAWEREIQDSMMVLAVSEKARAYFRRLSMKKILEWIIYPDQKFGSDPGSGRNLFLSATFERAVNKLMSDFGPDITFWKYGQENYKHIALRHALDPLLSDSLKGIFNTGILPRGGNSYTVNNTTSGNNQTHGASFRIIVDTGDFDKTVGCNSPGQSGDPRSNHYNDLFELWSRDEYFPVYYSKEKVMENKDFSIVLKPGK